MDRFFIVFLRFFIKIGSCSVDRPPNGCFRGFVVRMSEAKHAKPKLHKNAKKCQMACDEENVLRKIEEIKELRRLHQIDDDTMVKEVPTLFASALTREAALLASRNLMLWQLAGQKFNRQVPLVVSWPQFDISVIQIQAVLKYVTTEADRNFHECLERYFATHPELVEYFANFGCSNLFQQYMSLERLQQAEGFFLNHLEIGLTKLTRKTIANFVLHSIRFMNKLRERFLEELCQLSELSDVHKIEALKTAFEKSVGDLTEHHVHVLQACMRKDMCVTQGMLVRRVLVTCLKMWEESDEFTATTFLQSEKGHLWELLLDRSTFDYEQFCREACSNIADGSYCSAIDFAYIINDNVRRLLSMFDLYFLVDLGRDRSLAVTSFRALSCENVNMCATDKAMEWFYTKHGSTAQLIKNCVERTAPQTNLDEAWSTIRRRERARGHDPLDALPGIKHGKMNQLTVYGVESEYSELKRTEELEGVIRQILQRYPMNCQDISELEEEVRMLSIRQAKESPMYLEKECQVDALTCALRKLLNDLAYSFCKLHLDRRTHLGAKFDDKLRKSVRDQSLWEHRENICERLYDCYVDLVVRMYKSRMYTPLDLKDLIQLQVTLFELYEQGQWFALLESLQPANKQATWLLDRQHATHDHEAFDQYLAACVSSVTVGQALIREIIVGKQTSIGQAMKCLRFVHGLVRVCDEVRKVAMFDEDMSRYVFDALFDDKAQRDKMASLVGSIAEAALPMPGIPEPYRLAIAEIKAWISYGRQ